MVSKNSACIVYTYLRNYGSMLLLQQMNTLYNLYHKYLDVGTFYRNV